MQQQQAATAEAGSAVANTTTIKFEISKIKKNLTLQWIAQIMQLQQKERKALPVAAVKNTFFEVSAFASAY